MKKKWNLTPVIDYRSFRLSKLNTPEFSHLKWLIFWPIFAVLFWSLELLRPPEDCYVVLHPLDKLIPFCEIFVIPYMFWFALLVVMYAYTLLYDVNSFRRLMKFTAITYTVTLIVYFLFPTCQNLRPAVFARDNILTQFMMEFYEFDTNTNVCPSIHVLGSAAACFAGLHAPKLQKRRWKLFFIISTILICLSTVFLKQHSILDVLWALPLCTVAYYLCYGKGRYAAPKKDAVQRKKQ